MGAVKSARKSYRHMKNFRSSLAVHTATSKEVRLVEAQAVYTFPSPFALHPRQDYLYLFNGDIEVYTTTPMNMVDKIPYRKSIRDMLLTADALYILNDDSIIVHSADSFNVLSGDFRDCKLQAVCAQAGGDGQAWCIGVQRKNVLEIYDGTFRRENVFRCQCSHASRDILLLGDFNRLVVFIKGNKAMEVALPENISSVTTDPLFSRVFCAGQDNAVYCVSVCGEPLQKMEYHTSPVKFMRISFCGEFLYTADANRLCVWNTASLAVLGFVDFENPIEGLGLILEGNRVYGQVPIDILR